jgi:glycolate oxidase iron-sulfur subunit
MVARLMLAIFRREWLLRPALALSRMFRSTRVPALLARLPGRIGFSMAMLDSTRRAGRSRTLGNAPAVGRPVRGTAAVLLGCVMEGLFGDTNRATERVLLVNGYGLSDAPGQQCCGALHAHAGDLDGARILARANVRAFDAAGADVIAVNSAGCGAMMKEYVHLLADDPQFRDAASRVSARVRDISELLAAAGPTRGGPLPVSVTYDAPCHLIHAQRIVSPPLQVLGMIDGLSLVPLEDADQCCGAAGIYSLVEPETSAAVLAPKIERIARTGAKFVATGNPGCLMQIGAGLRRAGVDARAVHPVELLDAAYRVRIDGGAS